MVHICIHKCIASTESMVNFQGKPPTDKAAISAIKTASGTGLSDEDAETFAELAPLAAGGGRDIIGLLNGLEYADTQPRTTGGTPDENETKIIEEVMSRSLDVLRACKQSDPQGGGLLQREVPTPAMVKTSATAQQSQNYINSVGGAVGGTRSWGA